MEKVQDGVLPAGNSVAGGTADLHQCCIIEFSCDRDGLFDEAEENPLHKDSPSPVSSVLTTHLDALDGLKRAGDNKK